MFQREVHSTVSPGVVGGRASANPTATYDAGPGALVAGQAAIVGLFHWVKDDGSIESICPTTPLSVPQGFLANELQAIITVWMGESALAIPTGLPVTLFTRGDFWAQATFAPSVRDEKVFVNKFGQVLSAPAGSFPTVDVSNTGVMTSARIDNGTAGTVGNTVTVATGSGLEVGQALQDPSTLQIVGYLTEQVSGTPGGAGVYTLNQNAHYPAASAFTIIGNSPTGFVGTATFATNVMTVVSTTSGAPSVGQFVQSAGVAAGTYITVDNLDGTYDLSTSPGTITPAQAAETSGWIETPWSIKSDQNAGDLVKIGIAN